MHCFAHQCFADFCGVGFSRIIVIRSCRGIALGGFRDFSRFFRVLSPTGHFRPYQRHYRSNPGPPHPRRVKSKIGSCQGTPPGALDTSRNFGHVPEAVDASVA